MSPVNIETLFSFSSLSLQHPIPTPTIKMAECRKFCKLRLAIWSLIFFLALTGLDLIGPYPVITPVAHFIVRILPLFLPLVAPLLLGLFIKICRHEAWPSKKAWVVFSALLALHHMLRASRNIYSIWRGKGTKLNKVEAGLIVMVIAGEFLDIKWEGGMLDKWLEKVVAVSIARDAAKKAKEAMKLMEQGQVDKGEDLKAGEEDAKVEEKDLKAEEMFVSAEEEKRALEAQDEAAKKEVEGVSEQV